MSEMVQPDPIQRSHDEAVRILVDGESVWDERLIRVSHWLNPILVKETRQALKSRQFSWTFMLLIIFTIAWTSLAVLSSVPNVYYDSDGSVFLFGYLIILLLPSIFVIPQAAFRSMSAELEDGTFETLSLSMLSSGQIVYGKLSVAALQMIVYLSILAPCIALTYLLRGVTLESIVILLLVISVVCMFLCATSILLAAAARTRTIQILFSIVMILLQLIAVVSLLFFITFAVGQQSFGWEAWQALAIFVIGFIAYSWLWLRCASSLIDMASANRSTSIRVAVFMVGLVIAVGGTLATLNFDYTDTERNAVIRVVATFCWIHWGMAGAWMMGESGIITQRARRTLPDSYFGRVFLTWFNPGAGPAYLFVVLGFLGPWIGYFAVTDALLIALGRYEAPANVAFGAWVFVLTLTAYLALYLGLVRLALLLLYRKLRASRILVSFAMTGVLMILSIFASLIFSLVENQYQDMDFGWYCFMNPIWTLSEMSGDFYSASSGLLFNDSEVFLAWLALTVSASIVFLTNAVLASRDVMITRVETPPRVVAEKTSKQENEESDPWKET
jgi:hypothetical protein